MKNTRIILALILIITTLTSCRSADSDEPVNMEELMKIRTWMVDKDLEGKGVGDMTEIQKTMTPATATGFQTTV